MLNAASNVIRMEASVMRVETVSVARAELGQTVPKASSLEPRAPNNQEFPLSLHCTEDYPDFPTNPAAKLDVALSLLAAIILLSLVLCAVFPISAVQLRCLQRWRRGEVEQDSQLGMSDHVGPFL